MDVKLEQQSTSWSCGPAALKNALACYSLKVSEKRLSVLCNTTRTDGTDENGLKNAIVVLGYTPLVLLKPSDFRRALTHGYPIIAVVDKYSHWVTVVGRLGKKFVVVDPDKGKVNRKQIPTFIVSDKGLRNHGRCYGIAVKPSQIGQSQ